MLRRHLVLPVLALAALVATGCEPAITGHHATQDLSGPVEIVTNVCGANGNPGTPGDSQYCDGNVSLSNAQLVAGYLVPEGSTLVSSDLRGHEVLEQELTRDESIEAYLDSTSPAGAGLEWVGVRSTRIDFPRTRIGDAEVRTVFDPPAGDDATAASFPHSAWLKQRTVFDDVDAAEPVDCVNACLDLDAFKGTDFDGVVELRYLKSLTAPESAVSAERGSTASVPFTARYVGAAPSGSLLTTATSKLPVQRGLPRFSFDSTGSQTITATVEVPDDAPLGVQDVKLTVQMPGGGEREATGKVDVKDKPTAAAPAPTATPAPPASKPAGPGTPTTRQVEDSLTALKLRSIKRSSVLRDGLRFRQSFALAGRATWELRRAGASAAQANGAVLGKLTRRIAAPGFQRMTLPLSASGRRSLRAKRIPSLVLRTTYVDALGRRVSVTTPVRLR